MDRFKISRLKIHNYLTLAIFLKLSIFIQKRKFSKIYEFPPGNSFRIKLKAHKFIVTIPSVNVHFQCR